MEIDSWEERELPSERRLEKGAMVMQMGLSRTPDSSPGRSEQRSGCLQEREEEGNSQGGIEEPELGDSDSKS